MRQRMGYLLGTYLLTVLVFAVAKVAFMLVDGEGGSLSAVNMALVWWHGLSLDLSTALYFVALPFLACLATVWLRVPSWLLRGYWWVVALAFALAFVADTSLYPFWHFKLNASCLQYLETPAEAAASVSTAYLLVRLVALLLLTALIGLAYSRLHTRFDRVRHRWLATLGGVLLMPLIVVGMRGGLDESTTNVGQVYFSQNQFLNHSAVNPVFSFLASFEKTANHIVDYDYYSQQECDSLMAGLYPADMQPAADTLLLTSRPDVVVVLMESAGENMADAMPRLQQLRREGIDFTRCYANSWRTDRGTVCTYSGYPSFPTSSVMKMPLKTQHLPSLARTLLGEGYQTAYYYGGDINFTNMRSYLVGTGFEQLTWKKDFAAGEQASAKWGVRDDLMFDAVYRQLCQPHDRPLLIGFSTLSSHEPWDVPQQKLDDPVKNAFRYLDDCIGRLVDRLKNGPHWQNTLIVLLPDHSIDWGGSSEAQPDRNLMPMVWVGGAVKHHVEVDRICNQTDMAATLLAQLHVRHDDFRWSRDVLSADYRYPFAVHNYDNGYAVYDSTGFVVYDLDARRLLAGDGDQQERLLRMGRAILQATTRDLKDLGM